MSHGRSASPEAISPAVGDRPPPLSTHTSNFSTVNQNTRGSRIGLLLKGKHPKREPSAHDYEGRYPEDESGQETGPNARVWRVYMDEALRMDNEMIERWRDNIDVLLVFAGLFSAVVTAFLVEATKKLQPDNGEINTVLLRELIQVQRASADGTSVQAIPTTPPPANPFDVSSRDLWINGLWVSSLVASISVALMATVVRQWLHYYATSVSGNLQQCTRIRQLRRRAFDQWGVKTIVGIIPLLLHVSVFLFLWGLFLFFLGLNRAIAWSIAVIGGVVCAFYLLSAFLPLFSSQCPYRISLTSWMYQLRRDFGRRYERHTDPATDDYRGDDSWPQNQERLLFKCPKFGEHLDLEALVWMSNSSNHTVQSIAAQAIGSLHDKDVYEGVKKHHSYGLEGALLRLYSSHGVLSAGQSDRAFRAYYCLSKWRFLRLCQKWDKDHPEKAEAQKSIIRMVDNAIGILQQEHAAALRVQDKLHDTVDPHEDVLAGLEEDQARAGYFFTHLAMLDETSANHSPPEIPLSVGEAQPAAWKESFIMKLGKTPPYNRAAAAQDIVQALLHSGSHPTPKSRYASTAVGLPSEKDETSAWLLHAHE